MSQISEEQRLEKNRQQAINRYKEHYLDSEQIPYDIAKARILKAIFRAKDLSEFQDIIEALNQQKTILEAEVIPDPEPDPEPNPEPEPEPPAADPVV